MLIASFYLFWNCTGKQKAKEYFCQVIVPRYDSNSDADTDSSDTPSVKEEVLGYNEEIDIPVDVDDAHYFPSRDDKNEELSGSDADSDSSSAHYQFEKDNDDDFDDDHFQQGTSSSNCNSKKYKIVIEKDDDDPDETILEEVDQENVTSHDVDVNFEPGFQPEIDSKDDDDSDWK